MKKMIYTLALLCLVFAQKNNQIKRALTNSELNGAKASSRNFSIPKTLSYQGLLTKDNGSPVSDGQYTITFSFYSSLTGGSKLWEEVQEVNIADGIISATLGMSNPVDFASNESYLEISIGDVLLEPRQTLTSVLYSMASDTANYAQGGSYLNLDNLPDLDSVAFTGDYNDLINVPDLSGFSQSDTLNQYTLTSDLSTVALSNDYNDLTNLPDLSVYANTDTLSNFLLIDSTGSMVSQDSDNIVVTGGSVTGIVDLAVADGGTGASDVSTARQNLGLEIGVDIQAYDADVADLADGELSAEKVEYLQNVTSDVQAQLDAVTDVGLSQIAALDNSDGNLIVGSEDGWIAESGEVARATLGLGSIATQNSDAVTITGGSVAGIIDLTVADGGTGASDVSTARQNLGLEIGVDIQAYDADVADLADGELSSDKVEHGEYFIPSAGSSGQVWTSDGNGAGEWQASSSSITGSASTIDTEILDASRAIISNADGNIAVSGITSTELGYLDGVTSNVQSQLNEKQTSNTNLDAITNLAHGDGNIIVSDGSTWVIERGATAQTSLGLRVGFDVQGYDDDLSDLSDGELSSDKVEHGEFFIPSAGTNGQVWTSDGDGVGSWGDASVSITGSASTIDTETLDASRAIVTDSDGNIAISDVTSSELSTLDGVTSNVQAQLDAKQASDADLDDIAGLDNSDGKIIVGSASGWVVESDATARTSLGLGSIATQGADAISITGGSVTGVTDITVADGGTGASDIASARQNLGLEIGVDVQGYDADLADLADGTLSASKVENGEYFISSVGANGKVWTSDGDGAGEWTDVSATKVLIADNESTDEANALVFTPDGDVDGGSLSLESDGDATYNPSTGVIGATGFKGSTIVASTSVDVTGSSGLIFENDETITNSDDGTLLLTATTTSLTGDLAVSGNDIFFGNEESISNSTNGTVVVTATTIETTGELVVGDGSSPGLITSKGDFDITLQTGNSTTGSITITDGADGNIAIVPNGSGVVQIDGLSWPTSDGSSNQVLKTDGSGALSWSTPSTSSTTVTVTDNENTNEGNALIFAADADLDGGTIGLESDGDATYNPSTGTIAATNFSGNLTGTLQTAAQPNVTSVGTLGSVDIDGGAIDGAAIGANSASTGAFTNLSASGTTDLNSTLNTSGTVSLDGSANELRFYEGSNYVGFEAPSLDADQIWTLPTADGSSNQVLKTDGSGALSWSSAATSVTGLSDALVEDTGSMYVGNDPSSSTDAADYNVALGTTALDAVTTGDSNTALGYNTLTANLAGNRNTAVGTNALKSNTTGITNVALGSSALEASTTANSNTAVGHASSFKLSSGQNNVTLGYEASKNMTNANDNVIIGSGANPSADTGTANQIVLGKDATGQVDNSVVLGNADVTAVYMAQDKGATVYTAGISLENDETITNSTDGTVVINGTVSGGTGSAAGVFTSNGDQDITIQTGNSTTGSITITDGANGNIALTPNGSGAVQLDGLSWPTADGSANQVLKTDGSGALSWSTPSSGVSSVNDLSDALVETNSIFLGQDPSSTTSAAQYNASLGTTALDAITTGDSNTALGYDASTNLTTGNNNVAIGYEALRDNQTNSNNVAIGLSALQESKGAASNIAIGANAMRGTTNTDITGGDNVAIGSSAMKFNITGESNISIGKNSLASNTGGSYNSALGKGSLNDNTDGTNNTAVGYLSGNSGTNDITTGTNNTLLGASSSTSAATGTNQSVIGYGATGQADNSVVLGNADVTAVYMAQDKGATVHAAGADLSGSTGLILENDETITNSTDGTVLINGTVSGGTGSAAGVFTSNGDQDVTLQTGNSTTGSITITDGANGNIALTPNGSGAVQLDGLSWPTADGSANQVLKTDGSGTLAWTDVSATAVTVSDNENTSETNALVFTSGGDLDGGSMGLESDGDATYNPSTGVIGATGFSGATVAASTSIDITGATGLILENDEAITNSTDGTVLINGTVSGGTGSAAGVFTSNGDQDVTLQTGNSTTGSITITDGANGNIAISPNGSGAVQLDGLSWPTADGSANQVLKTDGSGALSWTTSSSGASNVNGLSDALTEDNSTYIGQDPSSTTSTAEYNVSVGITALDAVTTGDRNTAIGYNSLTANDTGKKNTAVGYGSMASNTSGQLNTVVGHDALEYGSSGNRNTAIGFEALRVNSSSYYNTGIGSGALTDANRTADTDGYNTALGYNAGNTGTNDITTGNKNTLLGASTAVSAAAATNQIVIGYGASGKGDNTVTIGNGDITLWSASDDNEVDLGSSSVEFKDLYIDGTANLDAVDIDGGAIDGAAIGANSASTGAFTAITASTSLDVTGSTGIILENDETITNSTNGTVLINGIVAGGTGSAAGVFTSNGDQDVTLQTGNSTTGSITITDGANGNIDITPNGTGKVDMNDSPLTGYGADLQTESGTSKTLAAADNGTIIVCSSSSAVTITVPASLPTGFNCMIIQSGSGQVSLSASSTTLNNRNGTKTAGQHAIMTVVHLGSDAFVVSGDTSSS